MNPVEVIEGGGPLILGLPHTGTFLPPEIVERLNSRGRILADTDWHIDRLYKDLLPDVTIVRARFHRYVIDANRPPDGESLYPGQNTTGLVPLTDFDGVPIWEMPPDAAEVEDRRRRFHQPYHAALAEQVARVRAAQGVAVLYDCHSIRSRIPFLFDGVLPDFNIGTASGASCDPRVERLVAEICFKAKGYSAILNGRFKGGWTTRHYGQPGNGVHAIQMELAQATHLTTEEPPFAYDPAKADALRVHLKTILEGLVALAPQLRPSTR
ncbi:N-formylglutamate deformylase [Pararhodobacter sp.]|uniref:N-formylglutamate deformylase n=1 Tax=Pararhodobacter sp. TaxID=2127056 RepID=UPI002FDFEE39